MKGSIKRSKNTNTLAVSQVVVGKRVRRHRVLNFAYKNKLYLIVAILVLILGIGIWAVASRKSTKTVPKLSSVVACSPDILEQSKQAFNDPTPADKLEPIVSKIKTLDGHDRDANCLYILTSYYVMRGDPANSKKYLDEFNKQPAETKKLNVNMYSPNMPSTGTLESQVSALQKQQKAAKTSGMGG